MPIPARSNADHHLQEIFEIIDTLIADGRLTQVPSFIGPLLKVKASPDTKLKLPHRSRFAGRFVEIDLEQTELDTFIMLWH